MENKASSLLSFVLLSQKLLSEWLFLDTVVFLGSSFGSFSNFLIDDFLLSRLSVSQFGFELFLFLKRFSLTVEVSSVDLLEDGVMLDNEMVCLLDSDVLNTDVWIVHDHLLSSESLLSLLVLLSSGSLGFQDFLGSKRLSFVNLKGELLGIDLISCLLLVSLDLE